MDSTKCSFNTTFRSDRNLGFFFSTAYCLLFFVQHISDMCMNFQQSVFHEALSGSWRLEVHLKKTWAVQEDLSFTGQTIMLNIRFTARRQIVFERKHHRPATTVRNKLRKTDDWNWPGWGLNPWLSDWRPDALLQPDTELLRPHIETTTFNFFSLP